MLLRDLFSIDVKHLGRGGRCHGCPNAFFFICMISQSLFLLLLLLLLLVFSLHYDFFGCFFNFLPLCCLECCAKRWALLGLGEHEKVFKGAWFRVHPQGIFFSARCRKLSNCTVEIKEVEFERFVLCFSNSQCQLHPRGMDCRCLFPQGTSAKSATFALPLMWILANFVQFLSMNKSSYNHADACWPAHFFSFCKLYLRSFGWQWKKGWSARHWVLFIE